MDVDARVEALEAENERLLDRIEMLEAALGLDVLPPVEWRLTGSEARIFGVLLTREVATKQALLTALNRLHLADEPEIKIIDVFVCKIRKKLAPYGIEVLTRCGVGYYLDAAGKARTRELLGDRVAA